MGECPGGPLDGIGQAGVTPLAQSQQFVDRQSGGGADGFVRMTFEGAVPGLGDHEDPVSRSRGPSPER
ncbi:hypothetical protein [Streptomyces sp. NPDC048256]|uniref:hypothetical protein n=1 Tax=Streptomyces sp. NPDC048256 TaxID=3154613 RepID=UPI0033C9818C